MTKDESFLLVSLKENQAKELVQVLSNDTARKILDYLSKNEHATETDISKALDVPLSTIHYNMQHLAKAKLVNSDDFTYSEKGKEIIHYSLSKKYVIIAPNDSPGILDRLRSILPAVVSILSIGVVLQYIKSPKMMLDVAQPEAMMAARSFDEAAKAETIVAANTNDVLFQIRPEALWFVIGAFSALILYFLFKIMIRNLSKVKN